MNEPGNLPVNQAQIDSRKNLFYLLQTLSKQNGPEGSKSREEFPTTGEQIETYKSRNGMV
jgi:hypothetical protein